MKLKLLGAVGVLGIVAAVWWFSPNASETQVLPIPGENLNAVVEVFNATAVDGLARTVTRNLRAKGLDVVYYGSARDSTLDSTQIIIRRGDSTAAVAVQQALGTGRIVVQPDTDRLVDVTILLHLDAATLLGLHP